MPRRLVRALALVFAAATISALAPAAAQAIPACKANYQCTHTYYATADRDLPIGGWTRFCDNTVDSWGSSSRYIEVTQARCGS